MTLAPDRPARPDLPDRSARPWWRRRSTLVVLVGLVLAVVVALVAGGGTRTADPLDPDNPDPAGAQAVARVLEDRGVEVTAVRGADALAALEVDPAATVLVVNPEDLGARALGELADRFADQELWVAGAGPGAVRALGSGALPEQVELPDARPARCADQVLSGLEIQVDETFAYPAGGRDCFAADGRSLITTTVGVRLLGAAALLTNDQVLRADNAAVALRILGRGDQLVWFVPSLADLGAADGVGLPSLLPRWVTPALGVGLLVLLATMLWRGRRLGALATEPLPVVVRAVETTESLGRLYRRASDRAHAATVLRRAGLRRARRQLQLGRAVTDEAVVRAVADHLARGTDDVRALLSPDSPAPAHDPELIALADALAELDREVRHR